MRRVRLVSAAATGALLLAGLAAPTPAAAHAIGQTFQLPLPLWLYLLAAAAAVGASFVVTALVSRTPAPQPRYPVLSIPRPLARAMSLVLRLIGLAWWLGAIAAGLFIGDISPLPAVLFWIGMWVGLPIVAVSLGNPWPSLSPFRTLFGLLERAAQLIGFDRLDLGLGLPAWLARWPAVVLLAAAIWAELVLPGSSAASTVATLLIAYTILTLLGMTLFGRVAWLRSGELFEVYLGWFGRVGPIGRRVIASAVCDGCEEACTPERCIDCPECAAAADPGERRAELRPWFTGLTEIGRGGWSDAAFIVLALAGVSYDGLRETVAWGAVLNVLMPPLLDIFGPTETAFTMVGLAGLALVFGLFMVAFLLATGLTRWLSDLSLRPPLAAVAGAYGATLLPIAGGYLIAHYLTLVIQGAAWLPELIASPLATTAPSVDWIPVSFVWYLSVVSIIVGHVAAIVLAHRLTLRDAPGRPVVSGLPLVALMIGYTIFSLWIIAQPITIEPTVTRALLRVPA